MKLIKIILKILRITITTITALLLLICVLLLISSKVQKNSYPTLFGYSYFQCISGSMEPVININDIVVVKKNTTYEVNDIVTYIQKDTGVFITHKIISIDNGEIVTKGDQNNDSDTPIVKDDIVGKVVYISPALGKAKIVLEEPKIMIILILVIIIIQVITALIDTMILKGSVEYEE